MNRLYCWFTWCVWMFMALCGVKCHSWASRFCTSAVTLWLSLFPPPPVLFHGYGVQVHWHPERPSAGPAVEDRGAAAERCAHRRAGAGAGHQRWSDQAAADRAGPVPQPVPASSQLPGDGEHRCVGAATPDASDFCHAFTGWCCSSPPGSTIWDSIFCMSCWWANTKAAFS